MIRHKYASVIYNPTDLLFAKDGWWYFRQYDLNYKMHIYIKIGKRQRCTQTHLHIIKWKMIINNKVLMLIIHEMIRWHLYNLRKQKSAFQGYMILFLHFPDFSAVACVSFFTTKLIHAYTQLNYSYVRFPWHDMCLTCFQSLSNPY